MPPSRVSRSVATRPPGVVSRTCTLHVRVAVLVASLSDFAVNVTVVRASPSSVSGSRSTCTGICTVWPGVAEASAFGSVTFQSGLLELAESRKTSEPKMPVPAWPVFVSGNEHVARKPSPLRRLRRIAEPDAPRERVARRAADGDVVEEDALRVPVRPQHVEVQRVERVHVLVLTARVRAGVERGVVQLPRVAADDRHRRAVRPVEVDHPDVLRVRVDHPDRREAAVPALRQEHAVARGVRVVPDLVDDFDTVVAQVRRAGPVRAVEERRLVPLVRARAGEVAGGRGSRSGRRCRRRAPTRAP